MTKDVIVALDFSSAKEVYTFLNKFEKPPFVKIGMELFFSEGKQLLKHLKENGHKIFLDLKCHDIPNTLFRTMRVLSSLNIDITNLHAAGASAMMKAALDGLTNDDGTKNVKLIAVTQLTSTDQNVMQKELLIDRPLFDVVIEYAKNAKNSGLDGVVCSPFEAAKIKQQCGSDFLTVTPGIRFDDGENGDQKRVATPAFARQNGSDYIVVGRPITQAKNPLDAYNRCLKDFLGNE